MAQQLRSYQLHDIPFRRTVALNVLLRSGERRMPRQLLHVPQRTAGFDDLLCKAGDKRPPAGMARRAFDPEFAKPGVEPYRHGSGAVSSRSFCREAGDAD